MACIEGMLGGEVSCEELDVAIADAEAAAARIWLDGKEAWADRVTTQCGLRVMQRHLQMELAHKTEARYRSPLRAQLTSLVASVHSPNSRW